MQYGAASFAALILTTYLLIQLIGASETPDRVALAGKEITSYGLKFKSRRGKFGGECDGYGVAEDTYFADFSGQYCGKISYEVPLDQQKPDSQVQQLELVYKVFATDFDAEEYYWRFWGIHTHEPLASNMYLDVTHTTNLPGNGQHTLLWTPPSSPNIGGPSMRSMSSNHLLMMFRSDRTFIKLTVSGFPDSSAPQISPQAASDLAAAVASRISREVSSSSTVVLRDLSLSVMGACRKGDVVAARLMKAISATADEVIGAARAWVQSAPSDLLALGKTLAQRLNSPEASDSDVVEDPYDNRSLLEESDNAEVDVEEYDVTHFDDAESSSYVEVDLLYSGVAMLIMLVLLVASELFEPPPAAAAAVDVLQSSPIGSQSVYAPALSSRQ